MSQIRKQLIDYVSNVQITPRNLLYHLYIYEDLLSNRQDLEAITLVEDHFSKIMGLSKKAIELPSIFKNLAEVTYEGVLYHCLARACIVGIALLKEKDKIEACYLLNRNIQSLGHEAKYIALQSNTKLKEYLQKYGGIHKEFEGYNDILENIWGDQDNQTTFEKSIFIMMPFTKGEVFRTLTNSMKRACKRRGYKAIRIDDKDRNFSEKLWDNLVINMLSCKYAIAVYVSEKVVDVLDKKELKMFPNPNVALEFGFFKSRGQKILLLKDESSPLPADLQGFLWHSFDINDPGKAVSASVNEYLDQIERENT